MELTTSPIVIPVYRGHTHAEFRLLQSSAVAAAVGRWIRSNLVEREYIPEGMVKDNYGRWVKRFAHWEVKRMFCRYDGKAQILRVPIAFCDDIIQEIRSNGGEVQIQDLNAYPLRKIDLKMNPSFSDRPWQIDLIKKCSEEVPGMKGLAMQTGKGKTYSAIKSAVNLGYATIVIVAGLMDQWIKKGFKEATLIKDEEIYKIEGFQTLALLAQHPEYKPKVFVASLRTMQIFCKGDKDYDLLPWTFKEFFKFYGIGTKIVDECHLNFHANTMMDLELNVPYNLYCSATFSQTGKDARRIFDQVFPLEIQYGINAYDKYISCFFYRFSGLVMENKCVRNRGYSHIRYEAELMKSNHKLETHVHELILPLIRMHYLNRRKPGQKMLLFCSSIEYIMALEDILKKEIPDVKIASYTGSDTQEVLDKNELIISTPGKCGTGTDIRGLITTINTVSLKTDVLTQQIVGRLRKVDGEVMQYVDMCDTNLQSHIRHAEERIRQLKRMTSNFREYNGLCDSTIQTGEISTYI